MKSRAHLQGVDVLRGVAISMVLAIHWISSGLPALSDSSVVTEAFWRGSRGVLIFFTISGFLITRAAMQRGDIFEIPPRRFYLLRAARILPMLAVTVALGIVGLISTGPHDPSKVFRANGEFDLVFWLALFLFVFNWLRMPIVDGNPVVWGFHWDVLWSLAVEEQFYIVFPWLLLWAARVKRLVTILIVIVVVSAIWRILFARHTALSWNFSTPWNAGPLAVGVLCALVESHIPRRFALPLLIMGMTVLCWGYAFGNDVSAPNILAGGTAAFVLGMTVGGYRLRVLMPIAAMGRASYEIYLLHPITLFLCARFLKGTPLVLGWIAYSTAAGVLGLLIHETFSQPVNRWIRRSLPSNAETDLPRPHPGMIG